MHIQESFNDCILDKSLRLYKWSNLWQHMKYANMLVKVTALSSICGVDIVFCHHMNILNNDNLLIIMYFYYSDVYLFYPVKSIWWTAYIKWFCDWAVEIRQSASCGKHLKFLTVGIFQLYKPVYLSCKMVKRLYM